MSDWTIRPAVPEDESCIAYMWLNQLCHGQDARSSSAKEAAVGGSATQIEWWEAHQPIVTSLIHGVDIMVACDPGRSVYEPGKPAVIWAWMAARGDYVYGFGIKRRLVRESRGLAVELAKDLLGDRLETPHRTVMDLVDLHKLRLLPLSWRRDRAWISSLRQLSIITLEGDPVYEAAARHVLDPRREHWTPNYERSA